MSEFSKMVFRYAKQSQVIDVGIVQRVALWLHTYPYFKNEFKICFILACCRKKGRKGEG